MENPKLLPLAILYAQEQSAVEGITRFQKLVFLAQKERDSLDIDEYEFKPDDFGPFSKELYDDIDELVDHGYAICETTRTRSGGKKKIYSLTEKGEQFFKLLLDFEDYESDGSSPSMEELEEEVGELKRKHNDTPLLELLKELYLEYPDMAVNSNLDLV
jgi:uncharacterized protein YwgA